METPSASWPINNTIPVIKNIIISNFTVYVLYDNSELSVYEFSGFSQEQTLSLFAMHTVESYQ